MAWVYDALVVIGLLLLGVALYLAVGLIAAVAYVGTVLIVVGVLGAWMRSRGSGRRG